MFQSFCIFLLFDLQSSSTHWHHLLLQCDALILHLVLAQTKRFRVEPEPKCSSATEGRLLACYYRIPSTNVNVQNTTPICQANCEGTS